MNRDKSKIFSKPDHVAKLSAHLSTQLNPLNIVLKIQQIQLKYLIIRILFLM